MDAIRVQHVIIHLLKNAIKFSPNSGIVKVTLNFEPTSLLSANNHNSGNPDSESLDVGVIISVIDGGVGITE